MPTIKEIALKAGLANFDNYQDDGKTLMVAEFDVTDQVIRTVESAVAELSKQNEPVAFTNSAQLGYVTSGQHQDIPLAMWSRNTSYSGADIPLYTFPPTAEQIANETAYAWVSVDERLPEVGFYLAWVKDDSAKFGGMLMILGYGPFAFMDDIYSTTPHPDADEDGMIQRAGWHYERDSEGEFDSLMFDMNGKVTHWMPLPTLPKRSMEGV